MKYYKRYGRDFNWKYEAENFARKIKNGAKRWGYKVDVKVLPVRSFSSSSAQRWNLLDRVRGAKSAETKTVSYTVEWMYKPGKHNR